MHVNEPAFPLMQDAMLFPGLTKRELFAAMAMSGFCATEPESWNAVPDSPSIAAHSVRMADALILELSREPSDA